MFNRVVKAFIKEELVLRIKDIVEKYTNQIKLTVDFRKRDLEILLQTIKEEILVSLFEVDQVRQRAHEKFIDIDLASADSLEMDFEDF